MKKTARPRVTAFQESVYDATSRIPRGSVSTYGEVGRFIGCGSPRAVGQALQRCPYGPEIPCHRVIASDGSVGGYGGAEDGPEIRKKIRRLREEGVVFGRDGKVPPTRIFRF